MGWPHRLGKPCKAWSCCWLSSRQSAGLSGIHWQCWEVNLRGFKANQVEKFNSFFLLSSVVPKQKLKLYKRVLRNSWKGCLPILAAWRPFYDSQQQKGISCSAWGGHVFQGTLLNIWVVSAPPKGKLSAEQWHTRYKEHVLARKMTQDLQTQACCVPLLMALCSVFSLSSLSLVPEICNHGFKNLLEQVLPSYMWKNEKSYLLGKAYLVLPSVPIWEDQTNPFDCTLWLQQWFPLCCQKSAWIWPLFSHLIFFLSASLRLLRGH